jgi:hypothetical protein
MTLDEIASAVIEEHAQFKKNMRDAVLRAKAIGELLLKAKSQLHRGEWTPWLKNKAKISHVWASNCMAIARDWDQVEKHDFSELSIWQASDVARGRPPKDRSGPNSNSCGRILRVLEERVADMVLEYPELADMVDAINHWRERLERVGQLEKKRGVKPQKVTDAVMSPRQLAEQRRALV